MSLSLIEENLGRQGWGVHSGDGRLVVLQTVPGPHLGAGLVHMESACPDATARLPGGAVQLHLHKGTQPRCSWQKVHPYREHISRMRARVHPAWLMCCSETKEFVFGLWLVRNSFYHVEVNF